MTRQGTARPGEPRHGRAPRGYVIEHWLDRAASLLIVVCVAAGLVASAAAVVLAFFGAPAWFLIGGCLGVVGWSWIAIFAFPENE